MLLAGSHLSFLTTAWSFFVTGWVGLVFYKSFGIPLPPLGRARADTFIGTKVTETVENVIMLLILIVLAGYVIKKCLPCLHFKSSKDTFRAIHFKKEGQITITDYKDPENPDESYENPTEPPAN